MEKFLSEKHTDLQQYLPFSYFNTDMYLDFAAKGGLSIQGP